jgi:hypothetical protein
MWRFHSPNLRGRYGEESEEGQDREEGQEVKSQKEEVVFQSRADFAPPGHPCARFCAATNRAATKMAGFWPAFLIQGRPVDSAKACRDHRPDSRSAK